MSWHDIDPNELARLSYPEKKGVRITRQPGEPVIVVEKRVPRGSKVIYLRLEPELHDRISKVVAGEGNVSSALVAIIEEALDTLEGGAQTWRVVGKTDGT